MTDLDSHLASATSLLSEKESELSDLAKQLRTVQQTLKEKEAEVEKSLDNAGELQIIACVCMRCVVREIVGVIRIIRVIIQKHLYKLQPKMKTCGTKRTNPSLLK